VEDKAMPASTLGSPAVVANDPFFFCMKYFDPVVKED